MPANVIEGLADDDALLEWVATNVGASEADSLGNGWADWKTPEIEIIKSGRDTVGAKITFRHALDGDHDYFTRYYVDALEKRIVAVAAGGYETNTEVDDVVSGDPISGASAPA